MTDFREDDLEYIQAKDRITVLKGGIYICEIMYSKKFDEILSGNFNKDTGYTYKTLNKLSKFVKKLELQRKSDIQRELDENMQNN